MSILRVREPSNRTTEDYENEKRGHYGTNQEDNKRIKIIKV
jgi:hypothetical protein